MYEVTIAIALFNAEKFIRKTMESALNQTFSSIEFLIINDFSNDESINIIDALKRTHPRGENIRIVNHIKNLGIGAARDTAINEAKGNYLYYLDSDDLITPNCIELLYNAINKNNAEIAIASYQKVFENGKKDSDVIFPARTIKEKDGLLKFRYQNTKQIMEFYVWNILYKITFIKEHQLHFDPIRIAEDVIFILEMNPLVTSCVLLPDITYTYVKRSNSLSQFNKRTQIGLDEVMGQLYYREYKKIKFKEFKSMPYAANEVTHIMKDCLHAAFSIIKKENLITPPLPTKDIKKLLTHPLTFSEIIYIKQHKVINMAFYLLGKLPYCISKILILSSLKFFK